MRMRNVFVIGEWHCILGNLWCILAGLSQIMPFLYFAYIFYALASTLMPMMGRFGTGLNPDLLIGGLCALGTIMAMGFVVSKHRLFNKMLTTLVMSCRYQWLICSDTLGLSFCHC